MPGTTEGINALIPNPLRNISKTKDNADMLASWRLMLIFVLSLFGSLVNAQPTPCGPAPQMTSTCIEACVICDIDGYQGINNSTQSGQEPPGFCTNTAHHMQWIAFIAGSTNLTITVTPSGCDEGDGLEVGIYQSVDCNTFQLVSNCDGDIQEGQVGVFTNTQSLVIGQYYYFVMDGNMDDICNYVIHVTSGSTLVPPLADAGPIQGPDVICLFDSESFAIPPITGATFYFWTLDGLPVGEGTSTEIVFPDQGIYELCVSAYNVCDTATPACQLITVLPSVNTPETASICSGDCLSFGDTTICDGGTYTIYFTGASGCDSVINLTVTEEPFVETDLMATICSTDSFQVGQIWFHLPGTYDITLNSTSNCDSIIHLTLETIGCEVDGRLDVTHVICPGDSTGILRIEVFNGSPPFLYTWQQIGGDKTGNGILTDINSPFSINYLPAGMYMLTIADNFGNDLILLATISEPPLLTLDLVAPEYNGFNISCHGSTDGQLFSEVEGGTPSYTYAWSTGDTTAQISDLEPQSYILVVTDAAGCTSEEEITLTEPDSLHHEVVFTDPGCEGINTGMIQVISSTGGVPPYQFSLSGGPMEAAGIFNGLTAGNYTLLIQDANGCSVDYSGSLTGSIIPGIEAGNNVELQLGYSTTLNGHVDIADAIVEWIPANGLSCTFCLDPQAMPIFTTEYILQAISSDGCIAYDSLTIEVRKSESDVYIPNVFSPNGDGLNDLFTVFGGRSVKQVDILSIFSRWGDLVLQRSGFMPNDPFEGWDGTFHGKDVQTGVYTWLAEIRFLDDEVIRYSGDLTLIR